jgi:preprotein translocase subunit SecG
MRMFRDLTLSVVALTAMFVATPVFAQQSSGGGVGFGVEFGLTRATIHAEDAGDFIKGRTGVMGGIWFGGNRNGRVGFMGEIAYVIKGAKNEVTDRDLKLHYLEIPALFRVNIGQRGRNGVTVYPLFGPVVDIQLKGSLDGLDVKDQFNGFDLGAIGGVGVEAARVGLEARGNWGLRSLQKKGNGFGGLEEGKNFTLEVLVKLRIN